MAEDVLPIRLFGSHVAISSRFYCSEGNAVQPVTQEEVRAPLPTRVERLYGDFHHPAAMGPIPGLGRHNAVPTNVVDAFRDFRYVRHAMHATLPFKSLEDF